MLIAARARLWQSGQKGHDSEVAAITLNGYIDKIVSNLDEDTIAGSGDKREPLCYAAFEVLISIIEELGNEKDTDGSRKLKEVGAEGLIITYEQKKETEEERHKANEDLQGHDDSRQQSGSSLRSRTRGGNRGDIKRTLF